MARIAAAATILIFVIAISFTFNSASAQTIVNGGFETGGFQGWTVLQQPNSGGNWFVYSGNFIPGLPSPPVGNFAAVTEQFGPGSQVLFQDILVPVGERALCSVIVYYNTNASGFVIGPGLDFDALAENQQARIDIISTDADPFTALAGVLLSIFQTLPGDPLQLGYTTLNFDLSDFAGTTVRFRAAEVDTIGEFNFAIDELTCDGVVIPTGIPTLGEWGMMAMAGVFGIAGLLYARRKRAAAV